MNAILIAVVVLALVGIIAGLILYYVAEKFKVEEDPRIDEVEEVLPGANCGGCGYPGCRQFAEACVKADSLDDLFCPVGGNDTMKLVAEILGLEAVEQERQVAVIRCSGSPAYRPRTNEYDGPASCALESALYAGHTDCQYGCLGHGDCVAACEFDAMYMDPVTQLPVVIEDNCTACGACVEACPKDIIELRPVGKKSRRIYVACINEDKGGITAKACKVGCIGCGNCEKACDFDAITIENALAYIDPFKCRLCRACAPVCPTESIWELNFPPRRSAPDTKPKPKKKKTATAKTAATTKTTAAASKTAASGTKKAAPETKQDSGNINLTDLAKKQQDSDKQN